MTKYLLSFLLSTVSIITFAQEKGSIQGKIKDADTKEPLALATVYLTEIGQTSTIGSKGTIADLDGFYRIEHLPGKYTLHCTALGYHPRKMEIEIKKNGEITFLDFTMKPNPMTLDDVVYSENKNPTKLEEATVSIQLVKPSLIQNRNATSGDKAIEQLPGVSVVDGEPQIRAASGFTAGLGSKVMILVDDVPMLRGDAGRPEWGFLPLENIDQIEVIKGSGSVLFGSGASNGLVNIRMAVPKEKPETMVSAFTGVYSLPNEPYKRPYQGRNHIKSGASFFHARIFKTKKLDIDFTAGGQFLWDEGYKGGEITNFKPIPAFDIKPIDSTRKNIGEYTKSGRINFNTRFRVKKIEGLIFGLNANAYYSQHSMSYFWGDADTNLYKMAPGTLTNFKTFMYYIDPYITYYNKAGDRFTFRNRVYQHWSEADVSTQGSRSTMYYTEFQYSKNFSSLERLRWLTKDLTLTSGVMYNYNYAGGPVFASAPTPDQTSTQQNIAGYLQLEKRFFSRLTIVVGGRYEHFLVNGIISKGKPIARVAANLRVTDGTFIRANWGQGFRFPTLGERYIFTSSGGNGFFPNDSLKPEDSWNAEVAVKQMFKIGKSVIGFIDVAGYYQHYNNYIEFCFNTDWNEGADPNNVQRGFKFFNTGRTRNVGVDISGFIQGTIKKQVTIDLMLGYTYSLPQSLEPNLEFYQPTAPGFVANTYRKSSSDTTDYILKYRMQHVGKADLNISWQSPKNDWGNIYVGFTARYYSAMKNVDRALITLSNLNIPGFSGMKEFMDAKNSGNIVFDMRVSYNILKKFKVAFIMENILNAEYSVRPMGVSPTRLSTVQLTYRM